MPSSTTQFLESRFGFKADSSIENNAERLLKTIKKEPRVNCRCLYQAVVRLSDSGLLSRMVKVSELKALSEATALASSRCTESLRPSLEALRDALEGYSMFLNYSEEEPIRTASLLTKNRCFSKHGGCVPLHNLYRYKANVIELLNEVTFDEIQRFKRHHPHFSNLSIPAFWPVCTSNNSFGRHMLNALLESTLHNNEVFGIRCKTATTSFVSMTQCRNKVYLGRLVNKDEYIAVKIAKAKSNDSLLCPTDKTVEFLTSTFESMANLYALYLGPSRTLISATRLGLCSLVAVLNALTFVKWLFLEGTGQIDADRLRLLTDVARSRYDKFPERSEYTGVDGYTWNLIRDLSLFTNPVRRFQYVNELGRRALNCCISFLSVGYAHQDIKPANIMFFDNGSDVEVHAIDYDSVVGAADPQDHVQKSRRWGTPGYVDPQPLPDDGTLLRRQNTDLFAIGITLREIAGECITGMYPNSHGGTAAHPGYYPTFRAVTSEFLINDRPTHLYHIALLLSGRLEYSLSGKVVRSRMDNYNYISSCNFFGRSNTLDESIFRRATLSLIKLGLSLRESHQVEMYRLASKQYGIGCGSSSLCSRMLSVDNAFARRERLTYMRTAEIERLEAKKSWPISEMMREQSSTNGVTNVAHVPTYNNGPLVSAA